MEKRVWTMPQAEVEKFEMNQYIAACGDENLVYKFKCTSGDGWDGFVVADTNGNGSYDLLSDQSLGLYEACGAEHEAPTTDAFIRGFYVPLGTLDFQPVIIWRGEDGRNVHCTTNLDMNSWETDKS